MISTGNDIVALKAINIARTKQFRFYSKIISFAEKELYDQLVADKIPFENFVWLLWSVKESAFKFLQRITSDLVFSPSKIIIKQLVLPVQQLVTRLEGGETEGCGFDDKTSYKCTIEFGANRLYSRSIISEELIVSVINHEDNFENTCWGLKAINSAAPAHQSKTVRSFLVNRLNGLFPDADLNISKSPSNYPILLNGSEEMAVPVSLAHHDHFVAYSFQLK
jgi:phosphopantetheinyl transferase (holo-ACP synthase)